MSLAAYELPVTVGRWTQRYVTTYRPVLLGSKKHDSVFVTTNGDPRTDISCVKTTVQRLLGVEVSECRRIEHLHVRRSMSCVVLLGYASRLPLYHGFGHLQRDGSCYQHE
jgi:hypothetical protein